jgi:F-type H+-transporting ATPase subunit a
MTGSMVTGSMVKADTSIEIGHHVTGSFLGLTVNLDTIWATAIAGGIVIGLGLWMRSKITSGVPSKVQIFWETLVGYVNEQVEANLGRVHPFVAPLAIALFIFILLSNWLEVIPSGEKPKLLPSPTADINLTLAMATLVIVGVWVNGIRQRGAKKFFKHFAEPMPALVLLNVIEEIMKPFVLALRLFGNIFASGIMIALIALMPVYILWAPTVLWKLFAMFIGVIQAFIFALLTVLYFAMAEGHEDNGEEDEAPSADTASADTETHEPQLETAH